MIIPILNGTQGKTVFGGEMHKYWAHQWIHNDDESLTSLTNRSSSRNTAKVKKQAHEVCSPRVWEGVVTMAFVTSETHRTFKEIQEDLSISFPIFYGCLFPPPMKTYASII